MTWGSTEIREPILFDGMAEGAAAFRAKAEADPHRCMAGRIRRPDGRSSAHLSLQLHADGSEVLTITLLGGRPMRLGGVRRWALAFWGSRWREAVWATRDSVRILTLPAPGGNEPIDQTTDPPRGGLEP